VKVDDETKEALRALFLQSGQRCFNSWITDVINDAAREEIKLQKHYERLYGPKWAKEAFRPNALAVWDESISLVRSGGIRDLEVLFPKNSGSSSSSSDVDQEGSPQAEQG